MNFAGWDRRIRTRPGIEIRACLQNGFCLDWEMIGFETRREEASISAAI